MTQQAIFSFQPSDLIGTVAAVDTARVSVAVSNASIVSHLGVGNLVAIKGITESEFLIGLIERVTRGVTEALAEPEPDIAEIPILAAPADVVRVVLIGTFRSVEGTRTNVFKRGADSFRQIDRSCHSIAGGKDY